MFLSDQLYAEELNFVINDTNYKVNYNLNRRSYLITEINARSVKVAVAEDPKSQVFTCRFYNESTYKNKQHLAKQAQFFYLKFDFASELSELTRLGSKSHFESKLLEEIRAVEKSKGKELPADFDFVYRPGVINYGKSFVTQVLLQPTAESVFKKNLELKDPYTNNEDHLQWVQTILNNTFFGSSFKQSFETEVDADQRITMRILSHPLYCDLIKGNIKFSFSAALNLVNPRVRSTLIEDSFILALSSRINVSPFKKEFTEANSMFLNRVIAARVLSQAIYKYQQELGSEDKALPIKIDEGLFQKLISVFFNFEKFVISDLTQNQAQREEVLKKIQTNYPQEKYFEFQNLSEKWEEK